MSGFNFGTSTTPGSSAFSFGAPPNSNAPASFSLGQQSTTTPAAPFSFGGLGSTGQYKYQKL